MKFTLKQFEDSDNLAALINAKGWSPRALSDGALRDGEEIELAPDVTGGINVHALFEACLRSLSESSATPDFRTDSVRLSSETDIVAARQSIETALKHAFNAGLRAAMDVVSSTDVEDDWSPRKTQAKLWDSIIRRVVH